MLRQFVTRIGSIALLCALTACSAVPAIGPRATTAPTTPAPAPATTIPPSATPPPPTPLPTATQAPTATLAADLSTRVAGQLTPPPQPGAQGPSIEGVASFPLSGTVGNGLWVAYTYGLRSFEQNQKHVIAIYQHAEGGWQALARFEDEGADYLGQGSVYQVDIEPKHAWIVVDGGVGAHGGYFELLSFDGSKLQSVLAANSESPGSGSVRDVNGDGTPDVVLDATEHYVFCYACGVREVNYVVHAWNGQALAKVTPEPLPESAPADLRTLVNRAVELDAAGLLKEAQAAADQAAALQPQDPAAVWDIALIRLHAAGQARALKEDTGYPLLETLFYGDYPAALAMLKTHTPGDIFNAEGTLIKGTTAESFVPDMSGWLTRTTTLALTAEPDLAAAYFIRAWGKYLADRFDPTVLTDVEKAAQLDPNEKLYADCVAYLKTK